MRWPRHPAIGRVLYPGRKDHPQHALAMKQMSGAGGVVTFDLKAGKWAAFETLNRLKLIDISNNLGDAKSLVTHPATTTHMRIGAEERAKLGIGDGTVRISVGLEDAEDIIADLVQALGLSDTVSLRAAPVGHQRRLGRAHPAHGFVRDWATGRCRSRTSRATWRRTPISSTPSRAAYAFCLANGTSREDLYGFAELIAGVVEELKLHKSYTERCRSIFDGVTPIAATRPMSTSCWTRPGAAISARPSPP